MSDLFGRANQVLGGGLSSDAMFMSWPALTNAGLGLLIQRVRLDYKQPLRRIFELGPGVVASTGQIGTVCDVPNPPTACSSRTQYTYYIIGRPEGRFDMQRFVGPSAVTCAFYSTYGNPCGGNVVTIGGQAGCNTGVAAPYIQWTMSGLVLDGYTADATAQEMVMQEGLSAMFVGLNVAMTGDPVCPFNSTTSLISS